MSATEIKDAEYARSVLARQLADRPRTRAELAEALRKRGVPDDVAEPILERFTEIGLIDDDAFARAWSEARRRNRGLAGRAVAMELRRKGVDDETVREVIDDIDPDDERETALRLVRKKLRSLGHIDDTKKIRRLTQMLARKGYGAQVAFDVVREAMSEAVDTTDWVSPEHLG